MRGILFAGLLSVAGTILATSLYAGQERREIKALSPEEIEGYLAGRGMGFAKTAELNGYPGPLHVLELAEQLGLSGEQRARTHRIFESMQEQARGFGKKLVAAERALERAFSTGVVDSPSLESAVLEIARLKGALRRVHLEAHLLQRPVLAPHQMTLYAEHRGYAPDHSKKRHGRN